MAKKVKQRTLIGAIDKIDIPEFDLFDIACRVDTGAALSSIHCHHVKFFQRQDKDYISFQLLDPLHPDYQKRTFRTSKFSERQIKSSFGTMQIRNAITTEIVLFGERIEVALTLADRERMQYPLLLGRNVLKKRFVVDVSKRNLSWKQKQK